MSRLSARVATIAAGFAIVLLVILLVIIWTGVHTGTIASTGQYRDNNNNSAVPNTRHVLDRFKGRNRDVETATTTLGQDLQNASNEVMQIQTTMGESKGHKSMVDWRKDILPTNKGELEYVRPLKISPNQYEDPPEVYSTAKRHHSGHFRHAAAKIWDPHIQYEFTAFGKLFRLRLAQDSSFVSPDIKVTHMSENSTRRERPGHQLGCFYSGSVDGDPTSVVTVSLCHGMTGHMRTSNGSYFIKPVEHWRDDKDSIGSPLKHAIYYVSTPQSSSNSIDVPDDSTDDHNCGVIDYDNDDAPAPLIDDNSSGKIYVGNHPRERRSLTEKTSLDDSREEYFGDEEYEQFTGQNNQQGHLSQTDRRYNRYYSVERGRYYPIRHYADSEMDSDPFASWRPRRALPQEYFIEITVVADSMMAEYHGSGLVSYILVLMSTVSRIYKDPSIGNPISIAVMKIVSTVETFGTKYSESDGISAAEMLKRFCYWQKRNNPDEPSPEHHDVALLLTRENLCHNQAQKRCDTLGLAELGRMCSPRSSCAIVQDNGLAAAFTIAHEIGHVLNMPHDDDSRCVSFQNRSSVHKVMSRMLDENTFPWEWSKCSRYYVTEFLEAGYANCLLDEPSKVMTRSDAGRLPGEEYSENKQCELVFGPGSKICPYDVCERLWCRDQEHQCHTQHMPWADGTACAIGKWCHRGECVSRRYLKPVHGQWSDWGRYGECSRTCNGGVKRKYRECNNPSPQNGGNYCIGNHVKYRSCGTKDCPPDAPDFREEQCSEFDNNNQNIQNLARNVKWHAKYTGIPADERCKLYCQVDSKQYYKLRDKVIDGTPCSPETFDICVNGHCKPAGCDHVINSTAELDTCGVCRGDNATCQRITGSYNSSVYGYTRVAKIPTGSSYIDIRQHGWEDSHNDSNYLALRMGEGGKYILNGNFMVMHRKVIVHPGITIEYSGPESIVERLNSSRPISVDLILEVLSVGNIYPPQITYEYTVPKAILNSYTWVLSDWSDCNRVCQGTKYRRAECRSTEHKDVMSDDYCNAEEKPREESQLCNGHCTLQWQVTLVSECSSHCGPGTRMITSRCVQAFTSGLHPPRPIPMHACTHIQRPAERETCVGPCDDAHWTYGDWGSCSVTCGGGIQVRTAICVNSNERQVPDDKCTAGEKLLKRICGQEVCPKWDLGEWTPCSVTCGVGKRERPYWCQVENRVVSQNYCSGSPSGLTDVCDMGPCHRWHAGDWSTITSAPITYSSEPHDDLTQQDNEIDSNGIFPDRITFYSGYKWRTETYGECSKSCNGGFMNRMVKCTSVETGAVSPDNYCDPNQRPPIVVPCNQHACPVWNTGDWSQCDRECNIGFQHRQVRCQSMRGEILPDKECSAEEKPQHAKRCQKAACVTNVNQDNDNKSRRWRVSNWTPCSKSCGNGVKTRRVECTARTGNRDTEVPVEDEQCSRLGLVKPKSQRSCQRIPCDYTWQEGTWSECSAECGDGIQRRNVSCHRVNRYGWIDPVPTVGCKINEKPISEQTCKLRECNDKYYWTAGPWRKCSHACGRKGRQIRRLFCHDRTGKKVPRFNCPVQFKLQRKQKCNQRRCGPTSCLEAQKRNKSIKDGEYSLLIGGKNMSIYCHGMANEQPREYLTLPSDDRDNYAEIYDKRLLNPLTCPFNGQRNDSCDCVTDPGTISGKTMFKRIRIDPVTLYIVVDDYTFSWTQGAKRVEFGKAGDCYSQVNCPQGRFSINLRGTGLRLSSEVTWISSETKAYLAIERIDDQRIFGKCGGYCSFCIPKAGLKLDVLPP